MIRLQRRRLIEIKEWRSAWRPFHCVPENCGAFERQAVEMVEMIDDLREIVLQLEKDVEGILNNENV